MYNALIYIFFVLVHLYTFCFKVQKRNSFWYRK